MENKNGFEQTMEILKRNISNILNEKDQSMAWLSRKIGTNDRYMSILITKITFMTIILMWRAPTPHPSHIRNLPSKSATAKWLAELTLFCVQ